MDVIEMSFDGSYDMDQPRVRREEKKREERTFARTVELADVDDAELYFCSPDGVFDLSDEKISRDKNLMRESLEEHLEALLPPARAPVIERMRGRGSSLDHIARINEEEEEEEEEEEDDLYIPEYFFEEAPEEVANDLLLKERVAMRKEFYSYTEPLRDRDSSVERALHRVMRTHRDGGTAIFNSRAEAAAEHPELSIVQLGRLLSDGGEDARGYSYSYASGSLHTDKPSRTSRTGVAPMSPTIPEEASQHQHQHQQQ